MEKQTKYLHQKLIDYLRASCRREAEAKIIIDNLFKAIDKRHNFDHLRFVDWFIAKNIGFMNSPLGFVNKCVLPDIEKGNFDKTPENKAFKINAIFTDLRQKNFVGDTDITGYIDTYYRWALKKGCSAEELYSLHAQIMAYLVDQNLKTLDDYMDVFKRSRFLKKLKAPISELDASADKHIKEWGRKINGN